MCAGSACWPLNTPEYVGIRLFSSWPTSLCFSRHVFSNLAKIEAGFYGVSAFTFNGSLLFSYFQEVRTFILIDSASVDDGFPLPKVIKP